jgi:hypothetical protein
MMENKHVAFDTELCAKNPEGAADRIAELERDLDYKHKALAHVLGSLIGATSILRYAHADNITPREVLPSDMIFFQTLTDYDNVIEMGRKALS